MLIKTLTVGQLEENCYIVTDERTLECAVIDPGDESNTILDYIEANHLKCKAVMLTHGHYDHTSAAAALVEETGCTAYIHVADDHKSMQTPLFPFTLPENGSYYGDGDTVTVGSLVFQIIGTPGHTRGGVSIRCGNALFTGDTLFRGSAGRVDLPGGDQESELSSLKKLCLLDGNFEVYPGHMDSTTLDRERANNYYCRIAMNER